MKVFISWSGRRSRAVANVLHDWMQNVIQDLDPWMSRIDIESGTRWNHDIAAQLEGTDTGILCITRSNVKAPWLLFEAGALSKAVSKSRVIPLLIDLDKPEIPNDGPLPQFQAEIAHRKGCLNVMRSLNRALCTPETPNAELLTPERLDRVFAHWWPELDAQLEAIAEDQTLEQEPAATTRRPDEILADVLEGVRDMQRRMSYLEQLAVEDRNRSSHAWSLTGESLNALQPVGDTRTKIVQLDTLGSLESVLKGDGSMDQDFRAWIVENRDKISDALRTKPGGVLVVRTPDSFMVRGRR